MNKIVGIRFHQAGKIYYFDPIDMNLELNDYVVVETNRGKELGKVIIPPKEIQSDTINELLKPVIRKADDNDVKQIDLRPKLRL